MDTEQIVSALIAERDRLNRAIEALAGPTKRRGRPSKIAKSLLAVATTQNGGGRRGMSAAARKAQSKRMKAYWAAKRQAKKN